MTLSSGERATVASPTAAAVVTDVAFDLVLAEIARNPILLRSMRLSLNGCATSVRPSVEIVGSLKAAYQADQRIYDAIACRDPDAAERELRAHLSQVADFYWRAVKGTR